MTKQSLAGAGLNRLQERLYCALLEMPRQTREELMSVSPETSRAKLTAAIDSLQELGLITVLAGRPRRYLPVAPDVAVSALVQQRLNDARAVQESIPHLMQLYWQTPRGTGVDFIEIVTGPVTTLAQRVRQLHSAAQVSVRGFERPPFPWTDDRERGAHMAPDISVERMSLDRGVSHRVIYEYQQVDDAGRWHADIRASMASGEEARALPALPLKLILFDDVAATTPLLDVRGEYLGSLVIHQSPLLEALAALFDAYWDRAVPLTAPLGVVQREGPARDHGLMTLLAAGLTDDAIARSLGVSRSTVQRRVRVLMEETGSRSRFQLGLQLARRWAGADEMPPIPSH